MSNDTGSGAGLLLGFFGLVGVAYLLTHKRCHNCGANNLNNSNICQSCGYGI